MEIQADTAARCRPVTGGVVIDVAFTEVVANEPPEVCVRVDDRWDVRLSTASRRVQPYVGSNQRIPRTIQ